MKHLGHVAYGKQYNEELLALVGSSLVGVLDTGTYTTPHFIVKLAADGRAIKLVHCGMRDEVYEYASALAYHRHKMGMPEPEYIRRAG